MNIFNKNNGVSVRAFKGDAMTLLAFDLIPSLTDNLAGFTIRYKIKGTAFEDYIYNRMIFPDHVIIASNIPPREKNSTLYAPIQKFNWVHVPNAAIDSQIPVFGIYIYEITPRHIADNVLKPIDHSLTVTIEINVGPFEMKNTKIGFTRGFVSSVAYAKRFNVENNSVRPNETDLIFDISQKADNAKRWNNALHNYEMVPYTYEDQHKWLGWQARQRILDFLNEVITDNSLRLKVFAYDLDEPEICNRLLEITASGRLKIILDDAGDHGELDSFEDKFNILFNSRKTGNSEIVRGHYKGLAHCKTFIILDSNDKALKVLTGSTNFSTNGIYINSNHVLVFDNKKIAECYNNLFDMSFSKTKINNLKGTEPTTLDYHFEAEEIPEMTITFAPHAKADAERIFKRISDRITREGNSDVLFAIMKDNSASSILTAVQNQLKNNTVFTYGITDRINKKAEDYEVFLYKPNNINGIRVAGRGIASVLPQPFGTVPKIDGYAIHHKFIVVNFRGDNPVVYCGSSNLAFNPEQKNGDNLLEIHDDDIVTVFAIEALRLVDHFHWRNYEVNPDQERHLDDLNDKRKSWYKSWFNPSDLKSRQRQLYIK
ncbi:phospholipase D-like domain-containing protein [Flavobacterium sp. LC2016-01]|uniref:phospholipase D-like domain-containing protein n=1 Tax=Flavobacterium sp. LC2016-01 TaxID=2675876 RepID=UPI0012BAC4F3|nr:phospholipase D-like domain-containing protein [Flavobacterium sp. LC2016-01]MTH13939.1 hypothetical protein [Flavobacterium sp. LC2016-01]